MKDKEVVIIIGGGIAGLTAASILAYENIPIILLEAHSQPGGCAGTFKRGKYIFDVGATQVAGLEPGGIHDRIFKHLRISLPNASILDPSCVVDLGDNSEPIVIWNDPDKWRKERKKQFPKSNLFWDICNIIHGSNWEFVNRGPILPIRSYWDFKQLIKSLRLKTIGSSILSILSIKDLLLISGCGNDLRLKKFLDLQLKLYSQEPADRTSALYGATVLQMGQSPLGLFHLDGSMQVLSNKFIEFLNSRKNCKVLLNHRVVNLRKEHKDRNWSIDIIKTDNKSINIQSNDVICTLTPQSLLQLMKGHTTMPLGYRSTLNNLNEPSGAIVFYGALQRSFLPENLPSHIQISSEEYSSIFISISQDGDGRAPIGEATIIASVFAETKDWSSLSDKDYKVFKQSIFNHLESELNIWLKIDSTVWLHRELATPKSFEFWTGRPRGIVGGLGQHPLRSGIFGLASRTPMKGLWLCGDSIHPGEGTAGVSQSALMACRQLIASRQKTLDNIFND